MKKTFNFQLFILLAGMITLAGCNKEKEPDPFTGKDDYIIEFVLKQDNSVFNATISNREITVTVPEGFSLTGAKATVTLSENASIKPDPAIISDWEAEQLFTVSAYNGAQAEYKYVLQRSPVAHEGSVVLETQADVDAFGAQGISFIDGNLTIGRATGMDSIRSLAPLASLKEVAYNLTLNATCALTNLEGLDNLKRVGATLSVSAPVETARFPSLETAGNIGLTNTLTKVVEFPELTRVSQSLSIVQCLLSRIDLRNLQYAGSLTITPYYNNRVTELEDVNLPELVEVGGVLDINRLDALTRVNLPKLKKAVSRALTALPELTTLYTPVLEEAEGLGWLSLYALKELSFPKLSKLGSVRTGSVTDFRDLESASFPLVTSVNEINLLGMGWVIEGFTALQSASSVSLGLKSGERNITLPSTLESVDYLYILGQNDHTESGTIDLHSVAIGELYYEGYSSSITFTGNSTLGTLRMNARANSPDFPTFTGFTAVDSLYCYPCNSLDANLRGIKKVNRGVYVVVQSATKSFNLLDMEEIGGTATFALTITSAAATATAVSFPKLKSVGGNLYISLASRHIDTLKIPALTSVGGDLSIYSSYDYSTYKGLSVLDFEALTSINGKLTIASSLTNRTNTKLANLNKFSTLISVKAIEITRMMALTDYSGLQNAFPNLASPADWSVTGNGYNPTYQDLLDRKWTKP